jgi:transcriptional regulator with XRE-family HTH domain
MGIGERLKLIRHDLGLSQEKFAHALSIHLRSYVSYENGHRTLPQNVLLELVHKGYDIHWLLTGEGKMKLSGVVGDINHPEYKVPELIPLIADIHAAFADNDLPVTTTADKKIPRPAGDRDPFSYAVKVGSLQDKSMSPVFSPEEIIFLSPMETVINHDKVIVKLKNGKILFRVMRFKDDDIDLMGANPQHPLITVPSKDLVFAHKVIGSMKL